ncbi:MAG: universal stress protein, partial [Alphaproteobacteria bacterium]|nr:universal stress protein [Alphaproteobacteria bacterium]
EEAREEAEQILQNLARDVEKIAGRKPEIHILEGNKIDEILALIDRDKTISSLVLAAGTDPEGPGPLVSELAGGKAGFHIPVTIVPGLLTDEQIDALT